MHAKKDVLYDNTKKIIYCLLSVISFDETSEFESDEISGFCVSGSFMFS